MEGIMPTPQVRFQQLTTSNLPYYLDELVQVYIIVYTDNPWNEWKKCFVCQKKWGIQEKQELVDINFQHCNTNVVDYWPDDEVRNDLQHEITEGSFCWIALLDDKIVGFCIGYSIDIKELADKLLQPSLKKLYNSATVAYLDEIAVVSEMRGQKIASALHNLYLKDAISKGLTITLARTKTLPPSVTYLWFKALGFSTIANYKDLDGRVVQAIELAKLIT